MGLLDLQKQLAAFTVARTTAANHMNHTVLVVLVAQLICWTGQLIGHGVFEKCAHALLDNLVQGFLVVSFYILLEILQSCVGYEPYPGFKTKVKARIDADIKQ